MTFPLFRLPRRLRPEPAASAGRGARRLVAGALLPLVLFAAPAAPAAAQDLFGLGGNADQSQRRQAELNLKIQQLEGQIRGLNGQVEQLGFQVRQLQDQMLRMQKDMEFRLQELEGAASQPKRPAPTQKRSDAAPPGPMPAVGDEAAVAGGPPRPPGGTPVPGYPVPGYPAAGYPVPGYPVPGYGAAAAGVPGAAGAVPRPGPGAPPQVIGQIPATADPIGGVIGGQGPLDLGAQGGGPAYGGPAPVYGAAPGASAADDDADAPPGVRLGPAAPGAQRSPGRATAAVTGVPPRYRDPPPVASPADEYDAAYGYILNGEYELAETSFRTFLANHPTDRRVGSAQYWLGESYFARSMNREAADAFLKSYTQYPDGPKAPDSLLKLGLALNGLGERKAACATYDELLAKYPKASKQLRDRAGAEKTRAKC